MTRSIVINIIMHNHKKIAKFDMIFRFDEFSRDLEDLMATLEHDFRKQDTYLAKDWYKKVILILTKRGAIDGVALKALPQFLKGVTTIISLEVCYIIKYFNFKINSYTSYI